MIWLVNFKYLIFSEFWVGDSFVSYDIILRMGIKYGFEFISVISFFRSFILGSRDILLF